MRGIVDFTHFSMNKKPSLIFYNVRIADIIEDVIDLLKMKADIRNIKLYSSIHPGVPEVFKTDPRRLKQIIINLVSNAIKFTFKGKIKITAKIVNGDKNLVKISVDDTGIGIKESDCGKLFQMFSMSKESNGMSKTTGTGMRLYVSK